MTEWAMAHPWMTFVLFLFSLPTAGCIVLGVLMLIANSINLRLGLANRKCSCKHPESKCASE